MKNWRSCLIAGVLALTGCGPEIPYDQDNVSVTISNQSGQVLVAIAAPVGTSFEDAVANHHVQNLGTDFKSVSFDYPNGSGEHDLWCFDQQYWIARSISGTIYIRDGDYRTATNRRAAEHLELVAGPKWYWSDAPGADPGDFEIVERVSVEECFETDSFVYVIEEDLSVTPKVIAAP